MAIACHFSKNLNNLSVCVLKIINKLLIISNKFYNFCCIILLLVTFHINNFLPVFPEIEITC